MGSVGEGEVELAVGADDRVRLCRTASLRVGDQGRQTRVPSGYADDVELWEAPVAASAYRHGYVDEDIRHAPRNLVAVAADPRDDDVTLLTAPTGRPT